MGLFGTKKEGLLFFYKLNEWWDTNFTEIEKEYIIKKYIPMGRTECPLLKGRNESSAKPICVFLVDLASWFNSKKEFPIAIKMIAKAEELFEPNIEISQLHFYYSNLIKLYYKDRENKLSYEKAKQYCIKQIDIALKVIPYFKKTSPSCNLPSHVGYEQLVIILEKEKKLNEALKFAIQAKNENWTGDWDKKIESLNTKIARNG